MSEGKGIEVRISATGGDQAAAEVRKPTEAMKDQAAVEQDLAERKAKFQEEAAQRRKEMEEAQTSTGFGGMLDGSPERLDESAENLIEKSTEAARKLKELQDQAKETGNTLPELREADVVAEALERLGRASGEAAGKPGSKGGGIIDLAESVGILDPQIASLTRGLLGVVGGPMLAFTAGAAGAAYALYEWKQALDEWRDAQQRAFQATDAAIRANDEVARSERQATEAADERTESARVQSQAIEALTGNQSSFIQALRTEIELLSQRNQITSEAASVDTEIALEQANGDPVKQEQIRNQARKEAQARELDQIAEERKKKQELLDRLEQESLRAGTETANKRAEIEAQRDAAKREASDKSKFSTDSASLAVGSETLAKDTGVSASERAQAARDAAVQRQNEERLKREADEARKRAEGLESTLQQLEEEYRRAEEQRYQEQNGLFKDIGALGQREEGMKNIFGKRDTLGEIRESNLAKDIAKRQEEEDRRKKEKEEADTARGLETASRDGFGAADIGERLGAPQRGLDALRRASDAMSRNPNNTNLQRMEDMLEKLLDWAENSNQDLGDTARLRELEKKVEVLNQRQKNARTGR